jgi:phospholipid-binding lipoprotein MlaA
VKEPKAFSAFALATLTFLLLAGCATVSGTGNPRDPWERYNRTVFNFNDAIDKAVVKPVAQGYVAVVPRAARTGVNNFFSNLGDVVTMANNFFQLKINNAASDGARVLVNSTIGVLGLVDVASKMGLPKHYEDFGQTMGWWGVSTGPYFMLPLLGPSTVRDAFGRIVDRPFTPTNYIDDTATRYGVAALGAVDLRANLLDAGSVVEEAAIDRYSFLRDAYLQRRRNVVYDGKPPKNKEDEEDFDAIDEPGKPATVKPGSDAAEPGKVEKGTPGAGAAEPRQAEEAKPDAATASDKGEKAKPDIGTAPGKEEKVEPNVGIVPGKAEKAEPDAGSAEPGKAAPAPPKP